MPHARTTLAALLLLAAAPLPAQPLLSGPGLWPGLWAAPTHLVPAQTTTASQDLVQLFSAYYQNHPIGSTLAPSTLRLLTATEAAALPALPSGQRYAETEGLIVKIDPAYRLVGIARRAPAPAPAQAPAPTPAPTAEAPAPSGGATSEANANANANATVNININDGRDDDDEDEGDEADERSEAISIAEAESRGIRIPRGHRPSPGACRLWIPGTPPGRQPGGSSSCDQAVPDGAVLIRG